MREPFTTFYHGTTHLSALNIVNDGVSMRLYVTTDPQLAADYALYRSMKESADRAVIAFRVPTALLEQWLACGSAQEKLQFRPFGCYLLHQPIWESLHGLPTTLWTFSGNDKQVSYVAA